MQTFISQFSGTQLSKDLTLFRSFLNDSTDENDQLQFRTSTKRFKTASLKERNITLVGGKESWCDRLFRSTDEGVANESARYLLKRTVVDLFKKAGYDGRTDREVVPASVREAMKWDSDFDNMGRPLTARRIRATFAAVDEVLGNGRASGVMETGEHLQDDEHYIYKVDRAGSQQLETEMRKLGFLYDPSLMGESFWGCGKDAVANLSYRISFLMNGFQKTGLDGVQTQLDGAYAKIDRELMPALRNIGIDIGSRELRGLFRHDLRQGISTVLAEVTTRGALTEKTLDGIASFVKRDVDVLLKMIDLGVPKSRVRAALQDVAGSHKMLKANTIDRLAKVITEEDVRRVKNLFREAGENPNTSPAGFAGRLVDAMKPMWEKTEPILAKPILQEEGEKNLDADDVNAWFTLVPSLLEAKDRTGELSRLFGQCADLMGKCAYAPIAVEWQRTDEVRDLSYEAGFKRQMLEISRSSWPSMSAEETKSLGNLVGDFVMHVNGSEISVRTVRQLMRKLDDRMRQCEIRYRRERQPEPVVEEDLAACLRSMRISFLSDVIADSMAGDEIMSLKDVLERENGLISRLRTSCRNVQWLEELAFALGRVGELKGWTLERKGPMG